MLTGAGTHACADLALDFAADLWHRKGLGEEARLTYEKLVLLAGPYGATAADIASVLGTTSGTVQRHLRRLVRHGLARRLGDGRLTPEWRDPEEVAAAVGSLGEHKRLVERIEAEQTDHRIGLLLARLERRLDHLAHVEHTRQQAA